MPNEALRRAARLLLGSGKWRVPDEKEAAPARYWPLASHRLYSVEKELGRSKPARRQRTGPNAGQQMSPGECAGRPQSHSSSSRQSRPAPQFFLLLDLHGGTGTLTCSFSSGPESSGKIAGSRGDRAAIQTFAAWPAMRPATRRQLTATRLVRGAYGFCHASAA